MTNCVTPQNCIAMKIILVKLIFCHNCTLESTVSIWHFLNSSSGNIFSRMFYWRIAIRHPSSVFHPPRSYNTLHRGASGHLSGSKKGHRLMGIRVFLVQHEKNRDKWWVFLIYLCKLIFIGGRMWANFFLQVNSLIRPLPQKVSHNFQLLSLQRPLHDVSAVWLLWFLAITN